MLISCSFDFCSVPDEKSNSPTENLGQVVFGERIRPSPYNVSTMQGIDSSVSHHFLNFQKFDK